jgi:hypothetical protein
VVLAAHRVFLAFLGQKGELISDNISIRSRQDGHSLAQLGPSIRGSQFRDEARLDPWLEANTADAEELRLNVLLSPQDLPRLAPVLADRRQILVPNTSCSSCHKLNELRFDFHNLSYLEDRPLTISPRVKKDVELDLQWLTQHGFFR